LGIAACPQSKGRLSLYLAQALKVAWNHQVCLVR
jgi:hypothetical protein